jgi:hypothetical protein
MKAIRIIVLIVGIILIGVGAFGLYTASADEQSNQMLSMQQQDNCQQQALQNQDAATQQRCLDMLMDDSAEQAIAARRTQAYVEIGIGIAGVVGWFAIKPRVAA